MVKKLQKKQAPKAAGIHLSSSVKDSAQQIWQAGLGAFTRAQAEGSKAFEALVKEGLTIQRKTQAAKEELEKVGTFEKGIFHRKPGEGKKNQDGFEALWEHINQKKLVYPKRRYEEPIIVNPASFAWKASDQKGVSRKLMGVFSERETRLEMEDWADGILSTLEVNLDKFLTAVKRGRERLHERSQESVVAGIGPSGDHADY